MSPVVRSIWPGDYEFHPFRVMTTGIDFRYSRGAAGTNLDSCKGSNISAAWTPRHQETLINGVLQGRKQTDPMGASALSRIQIWNLLLKTISLLDAHAPRNVPEMSSYRNLKRPQDLEHRRRVKEDVKSEALKDWNNGSSNSLFEGIMRP